MQDEESRELCLQLLHADTEEEVIRLLEEPGFWSNGAAWRPYGDREDNFSTVGNQQSTPEAALVEKVVNSIDALLIDRCLRNGVAPDGEDAPRDMHEAVALYFAGDKSKAHTLGHVSYWDRQKRTEVSRLITVAATRAAKTGNADPNPCFTIVDMGEGQTPLRLPETILSLDRKNKVRVPFVQGKFNMGGTGVLQFCGHRNMQLVISRRDTLIAGDPVEDPSEEMWGFTVVRREDPPPGQKSSVYTYLAPRNADASPHHGDVLRFRADSLPLSPNGAQAYSISIPFGTAIKLYEYQARGFRSVMFMRDGLLSRLDILLPEIALPIRLHECRDYAGHKGSYETTASGLTSRLGDNRAENLEQGYPTTAQVTVQNEQMNLTFYAFKKGRADSYRKNEGVIFTINGQTHGHLSTDFFRRKKVGMSRLADSLLVEVDCTEMGGRSREDLFMNSRDRLRSGELKNAITDEPESVIRTHDGLRALREERKRQEIAERLGESRPLEEALTSIMRASPALSRLFMEGDRLPNPFKTQDVGASAAPYSGRVHPTFFKIAKIPAGNRLQRNVAQNVRARIAFETDVENGYFGRPQNRGVCELTLVRGGKKSRVRDHSLNLHDGKATLNVTLPDSVAVGEVLEYSSRVFDDTLVFPFENVFALTVTEPQETTSGPVHPGLPPSTSEGHGREVPKRLDIPEIHEVTRADWTTREPAFDDFSALEVMQENADAPEDEGGGQAKYSFWVNVDNKYLATETKATEEDPAILRARFVYGMVLLGMALLRSEHSEKRADDTEDSSDDSANGATIENQILNYSKAAASVLLPMISALGALDTDNVVLAGASQDDD